MKNARRLETSPRWRPAFSGARPGTPLLVQRMDRNDSYYYIVEYRRDGAVTARIIVDATTGRYLEAKGIEQLGQSFLSYREAPSHSGAVPAVGEQPVFYWRPCRQSKSPFTPFYQRLVGGAVRYIRVDGEEFTELTDGPA